MLLQEVSQIKEKLSSLFAKNSLSECILLLDRLSGYTASTEGLRASKIGLFLNNMRKNTENEQIPLVVKWKADIGRSTPTAPARHSISISDAPSPLSAIDDSKSPTTPTVIERTISTDNIFFTTTHDKVRDKCIEMVYSALATGSDSMGREIIDMALQIESITNKNHDSGLTSSNLSKYKSRIRSLVSNLKDKKNTLRSDLMNGDLKVDVFSNMTSEEMMSTTRRRECDEAYKEIMLDAVSATQLHAVTDMFRCGKCGKRKTTYYQMQTRSADEPMTTFVTCVNCDNRWKFC